MLTSKLPSLASVITWELSLSKTLLSGYDLAKRFKERGVPSTSHQQVYRELGKMEKQKLLHMTYIPQQGKPDRKEYALIDGVDYTADIEALRIDQLDKYNVPLIAIKKRDLFEEQLAGLDPDLHAYCIHSLRSDINYLNTYIQLQEIQEMRNESTEEGTVETITGYLVMGETTVHAKSTVLSELPINPMFLRTAKDTKVTGHDHDMSMN